MKYSVLDLCWSRLSYVLYIGLVPAPSKSIKLFNDGIVEKS